MERKERADEELSTEMDRLGRVLRDLESHPTLSTGGLMMMRFCKFMLQRKRVKHPVECFRWLREHAVSATIADREWMKIAMTTDDCNGKPFILLKVCIPSRPDVQGGVTICLKARDNVKQPYFEMINDQTSETYFNILVRDLFCTSSEYPSELRWIRDGFTSLDELLWIMMLLFIFDPKENRLRTDKIIGAILADCDVLHRLYHECFMDTL